MNEVQVNELDSEVMVRRQSEHIAAVLQGLYDHSDSGPGSPMVLILPMALGALLAALSLPIATTLLPISLLVAIFSSFASFVSSELRGLPRAFALLGSTTAATWAFGIAIGHLAIGHLAGSL